MKAIVISINPEYALNILNSLVIADSICGEILKLEEELR
jgi:hypothetical protein